jgi:hydrogenase maturation protein HypF
MAGDSGRNFNGDSTDPIARAAALALPLPLREPMATTTREGRRIELRGTVQGVGVRPWIYRVAHEYGVTGRVWNHASGVTIDAFGDVGTLDRFVTALRATPPPAAVIAAFESGSLAVEELNDFVIVHSSHGPERRVSIPPDLATCRDCTAEIFDRTNRRYRYPFTNCTNCGPRFTIATDVPYDRPATTMAPFAMCPACQREYDDPGDRRFHAQPNACPVCGPRLSVLESNGAPLDVPDVIRFAAAEIAAGRIVALKGIGGFHLACDATSRAAVARLRARKHREEKPLAVMVRDIATAHQIALIDADGQRLLESVERPIVLAPRRNGAPIADEVAPRNPLIGVMLPYTPLHHLLLADAGVPLVMTSANLSEEPIVYRNDEAVARLGGIADVLLVHDREIMTRCDDSVATIVAGAPVLLRRSRGFVPRAITLHHPVDEPVLACGALLKNTFCIAHGDQAWFGPHIGDLENAETYEAYQDAIERMERFLGIHGTVVAHDLHPDYLSTRYAIGLGLPAVSVQHHHAHVASAIAEHGIDGPVIGVAFDGTGFGTDGTAWGGEVLVGDAVSAARLATFRPVRLAGGDAAIRQPWRIALALLQDAFGADAPFDAFAVFETIAAAELRGVQQMLTAGLNTPAARGVGRYFDGIGALVLGRPRARYEGQIAFELNMAAAALETGTYLFDIDRSTGLVEIDLRGTVQDIVADLLTGVPPAVVSARFHNTLAAATAAVVTETARHAALGSHVPVVLTGGCFQNARLAHDVHGRLALDRRVLLHRLVPPGDGGIALGQAVIAAAAARR